MESNEYCLQRKKVKHMTLRIKSDLQVYVTAPLRASQQQIDDFVNEHRGWIEKNKERLRQREATLAETRLVNHYDENGCIAYLGQYYPLEQKEARTKSFQWDGTRLLLYGCNTPEERQQMVESFYRQQSKIVISAIQDKYLPFLALNQDKSIAIRIRKMRASWGRCYCKRREIVYNLRLIQGPFECIEAVVLHELVHLIHPNHSKDFYRLLETMIPDYRQRKDRLHNLVDINRTMQKN